MKITQPLVLLSQLTASQGLLLSDHGKTFQNSASHRTFSDVAKSHPQSDSPSFASLLKYPQCDANTLVLGLTPNAFKARTGLNEEQFQEFLDRNDEEIAIHFGIKGGDLGQPDQLSNWDRLKIAAKFLCGIAIGLWGIGMIRRAQAAPLAPAAPPPEPAVQAAPAG